MARRLPSLNALRAFEAAARHESFTKAASDLAVTQGAVSHQVKALESDLGLKLFERDPQGLSLTDAGRGYLEVVRDAFDRLAAGTEELLHQRKSGVLNISLSPNFAAKWLVHRLGTFVAAHPDIDLRISASPHHVDFTREDIDLAIRHGEGHWPGLAVARLCDEELAPVCTPAFLRGPNALRQPNDLQHHTLVHLDNREDWRKWLDAAGADRVDLTHGVVFNQASMAIDAAVDGQGVALARTALAARDLLAGRLVRPFSVALPAPYAYFVVCPKTAAQQAKIVTFRDWLIAEAQSDLAGLAALEAQHRPA